MIERILQERAVRAFIDNQLEVLYRDVIALERVGGLELQPVEGGFEFGRRIDKGCCEFEDLFMFPVAGCGCNALMMCGGRILSLRELREEFFVSDQGFLAFLQIVERVGLDVERLLTGLSRGVVRHGCNRIKRLLVALGIEIGEACVDSAAF